MEVWTGWSPLFLLGGVVVARLWGPAGSHRCQLRAHPALRGPAQGPRRLPAGVRKRAGLPAASVVGDGGLLLETPRGRWGQGDAYVVVRHDRDHAARVLVRETFHMYVDPHGVLRSDHELRLWGASAVKPHYRLKPAA